MPTSIESQKEQLKTEQKHSFASLRSLVEILRSPEGCPWDAEQTHASIRNDLIEETYEVIEGIDKDDRVLLREELGDVLFQVLFHSRIEEEAGVFDIDDVIHDICAKMILRHPHVFGAVQVENSGEVLENWEQIKQVEKSRMTVKDQLESVPKQYPALMRTKKVLKKAARNGVALPTEQAHLDAIASLTASLATAEAETREAILAEMLFHTVAIGGADADLEKALGAEVDAFIDTCADA